MTDHFPALRRLIKTDHAPGAFGVQALEDIHQVVATGLAEGPLCQIEDSSFDASDEAYEQVAEEVARAVRDAPNERMAVAIMQSVLRFASLASLERMKRRQEELGIELIARRVRPKRT